MPTSKSLIPSERIEKSILLIRRHRVMLDSDLAELYGVENKYLKRQVRRNIERFPSHFMFKLNKEEFDNLRFQFGTSSQWGGLRYSPFAFTEQGVAMLSSVLRSKRAIQVNIQIIEAFVKMRQLLASHKGLMEKILAMEKKYDKQFNEVFQVIYLLMKEEEKPKHQIGYETSQKK